MWGGETKPQTHCPDQDSPSTLLSAHSESLHTGLSLKQLPLWCCSIHQPYSELRASLISCLIYPGPCAAATVKSISDVIPLLPQQCNSPALYCADGLSPIILFMAVGRFNRQREVWWGISNKGTMTG